MSTDSKVVSDIDVSGSVSKPNDFTTDSSKFYGLERRNPPDSDCPTLTHKYIDTNNNIDIVSRVVAHGMFPALLIGDTGTGKTECLKHIAHEIGAGFIRVNHNIRSEPEDILGAWIVDEETNTPVLSRGPLIEALEDGKIFYADELNYAKPGVLMAYQPVLENYGTITLTIGKRKKVISRHKDFRFVAAMNPISYAGSNEMSAATFNRFIPISFDYPTVDQEIDILRAIYPSVDRGVAQLICKLARDNRNTRSNDYTVEYIVSTRDLIKVCHLVIDLQMTWTAALKLVILNAVKEINSSQYASLQTLIFSYTANL